MCLKVVAGLEDEQFTSEPLEVFIVANASITAIAAQI